MENSNFLYKIHSLEFEKKTLWINEALFGFQYISKNIGANKSDYSVLEVGCGSGILLSLLSERFEEITFEGIEPFGDGFNSLKTVNSWVKDQGVSIFNIPYEKFSPTKKYNLIYLVNVFEHLDDWRHFLRRISQWLSDDGQCIILCPNYSFPYESHFGLPIIFTKNITKLIFKRSIKNFEVSQNSRGLWKSLNFVKKKELLEYAKYLDLKIIDNHSIIPDLVKRLTDDCEFNTRQPILGPISKLMSNLGILGVFKLPLLRLYSPYMMVVISKS